MIEQALLERLSANYKLIILSFSGIFLNLCFAPFNFYPLAFFCFFFLFNFIDSATSFKEAFLFSYVFGYTHSLIAFSWIGSALFIDNSFFWLWPICLLGIPLIFAFYYGFVGIIYKFLPCKKLLSKIIWFCSSWCAIEIFRTYSVLGLPWNLICYIWSNHEKLLQIAYFVSPVVLSWLSVFIFTVPLVFFISNKTFFTKLYGIKISVLALIFCFYFGSYRLNRDLEFYEDYKFSILQNNLGEKESWQSKDLKIRTMNDNIEFIKGAKKDFATHFFLGESGIPIKIYEPINKVNFLSLALPDSLLLSGTIKVSRDNEHYNSTVAVDLNNGEIVSFYDKTILVPFGEYIPLRFFLSSIFPRTIGSIGDFTKGKNSPAIEVRNTPKFINLICYESIFLSLLDKKFNLKNSNYQWILINTNDGWFEGSLAPYQHLSIAKYIAARTGAPVVRVANSGISALIDPYGRIFVKLDFKRGGVLNFKLPKILKT